MLNPANKVRDLIIGFTEIAIVILIGVGGYFIYHAGKVEKDFEKYKSDQLVAYTALQTKYDQLSAAHSAQSAQNTEDLKNANQTHETALADNAVVYGKRLLASEQRAAIYKRQAEAGTAECNNLASYAARLDSSIEEGRYVVLDLRATLGQRDETIRILGKELMSTRKLIESE